jgi:hypothetical protein
MQVFPLPSFDNVTQFLESGESVLEQWRLIVTSAAIHYFPFDPRSREHYEDIGVQLIQKFPSLRRHGRHPWVRQHINLRFTLRIINCFALELLFC